jgi:hypothetical protein
VQYNNNILTKTGKDDINNLVTGQKEIERLIDLETIDNTLRKEEIER